MEGYRKRYPRTRLSVPLYRVFVTVKGESTPGISGMVKSHDLKVREVDALHCPYRLRGRRRCMTRSSRTIHSRIYEALFPRVEKVGESPGRIHQGD